MGAAFNDMTLNGKMEETEVRTIFHNRCEQDGIDHGHSYSGSFSQFTGLHFTGKSFNTMDEARDFVMENGEKWGPAVAVRHKKYDVPKSALNHNEQRGKLEQRIWLAQSTLRNAREKARLNNRTTTPAYVTKAEAKLKTVKEQVQPKMDERTAKIKAIIETAAAKSNKYVWLLGGWCSC